MRNKVLALGLGIALVGVIAGVTALRPSRVDGSRAAESREVEEQLAAVEAIEAEERMRLAQAVKPKEPKPLEDTSPFKVKLECSNGTIELEINPEWAPLGAARFKDAVEAGVYDEARFFRVVPNFVVQFGIAGDPEAAREWKEATFKDDPVKESNVRGTLCFATAGPDTRTTQLFINLGDNGRLDGMGFSPIGKVVKGMEIVDKITAEYGERPNQGFIQEYGNKYLEEQFPNLDYIKKATVSTE